MVIKIADEARLEEIIQGEERPGVEIVDGKLVVQSWSSYGNPFHLVALISAMFDVKEELDLNRKYEDTIKYLEETYEFKYNENYPSI